MPSHINDEKIRLQAVCETKENVSIAERQKNYLPAADRLFKLSSTMDTPTMGILLVGVIKDERKK